MWVKKHYRCNLTVNTHFSNGAAARSEACPLGMQVAPSSILKSEQSATYYILSWRFGHENIFTAILSPPLIQEEQLSVTVERICTKYW